MAQPGPLSQREPTPANVGELAAGLWLRGPLDTVGHTEQGLACGRARGALPEIPAGPAPAVTQPRRQEGPR